MRCAPPTPSRVVAARDNLEEQAVVAERQGRGAPHRGDLCTGYREELNALTALVDDDGVDLSFKRRNGTRTLDVQVKARFSDAEGSKALREHDSFAALVGEPTFHRATISTCSTSPSMVRRAP
jgi:hypothetical protein